MGYSNKVRAAVYPPPALSVLQAVDSYCMLKVIVGAQFEDVVKAFLGNFEWDDHNCTLQFRADYTKWGRDRYPECTMFYAMLEKLEELGYGFDFIRVGEEDGDIETLCSGNNDYVLSTEVFINYDPIMRKAE